MYVAGLNFQLHFIMFVIFISHFLGMLNPACGNKDFLVEREEKDRGEVEEHVYEGWIFNSSASTIYLLILDLLTC